jgi:hypothetical protein
MRILLYNPDNGVTRNCCGAPLGSVSSLSSRVGDNGLRHDYHENSLSNS